MPKFNIKPALSLLCIFALLGCSRLGKPKNIDEEIADTIEKINKTLPKQLDAGTTLNSITLDNKEVRYSITLTKVAGTMITPRDLESAARPILIKAWCGEPKAQVIIKNGNSVTYVVWGNDGGYISEIKIKPSECGA